MSVLMHQVHDDNFNDLLAFVPEALGPADLFPSLPAELKALGTRFGVYTPDKTPFNARTHQRGNPMDLKDASVYQVALEALSTHSEYAGIAYGLQYEDGLSCFDFDHCIHDGEIDHRVLGIIQEATSYCEVSPSGQGIHLWVRWSIPDKAKQGRKVGSAEVYSGRRYLTCTGNILQGVPATIETRDMSAVYARICSGEFKSADKKTDQTTVTTNPPKAKESVQIQRTATARLTTKYELLMHGIVSGDKPTIISDGYGNDLEYPDRSSADLAFCTVSAMKHGDNPDEIWKDYTESSLYREKWGKREEDFRRLTITNAIKSIEKSKVNTSSAEVKTTAEVVSMRATCAGEGQAAASLTWRSKFCSVGQLSDGGIKMLINGFMPEGVSMLGALPGNCKTLLALSIAKALTTGKPFLGRFVVPALVPVLYLIPESSGGPFRQRCEKFGIPDDPELFLCRTVSQGSTLLMDDLILKAAVEHLKPLVILDTAIRFNKSTDENSSSANKLFVDDAIALTVAGARGILGLHHATKSSRKEGLTLESALRGTGDLAAMCDSVYGLRRNDVLYENGNGPLELEVLCLKPRDFEPPMPFTIAATTKDEGKIISYIDSMGDFVALEISDLIQDLDSRFIKAVTQEPDLSLAEVAELLGIKRPRVQRIAKKVGYRKASTGWRSAVSLNLSENPSNAEEVPI